MNKRYSFHSVDCTMIFGRLYFRRVIRYFILIRDIRRIYGLFNENSAVNVDYEK